MKDVIQKFKELSLFACADNLEPIMEQAVKRNDSPLQIIEQLLDLDIERRRLNRVALRYRQSGLREKPTIDQFDFNHHHSRKNQRNIILNLLSMEFIQQKKDVILIGNSGVGKSIIAKCIAYEATQRGVKTLFTTAMDMINHLIAAEADRTLLKKLQFYQTPDLLVVDEIGYLSLGEQGSHYFFQVISGRHEQKSTVITTNKPFAEWGEIFESTTVAAAIADRLVFNSEVVILEGESYRKKKR